MVRLQRHIWVQIAAVCGEVRGVVVHPAQSCRARCRFKEEAGDFWLSLDPYWAGEAPPLVRRFHPDGSLTAPPDDPLWGDHENRWRFTKSREGVAGQFVKVNHWPSLSISRTPSWGWRMENSWVVYTAQLEPGGTFQYGVRAVGEGPPNTSAIPGTPPPSQGSRGRPPSTFPPPL